ncbi:MAG: hypothetical protein J6X61_06610, partial [Clostridia bacterium]|nr:hypothetical protein [Clostridia bacterium]
RCEYSGRAMLCPLAVPDKRGGLTLILALVDRGANLASLHPPPAAVGSVALRPVRIEVQRLQSSLVPKQNP